MNIVPGTTGQISLVAQVETLNSSLQGQDGFSKIFRDFLQKSQGLLLAVAVPHPVTLLLLLGGTHVDSVLERVHLGVLGDHPWMLDVQEATGRLVQDWLEVNQPTQAPISRSGGFLGEEFELDRE